MSEEIKMDKVLSSHVALLGYSAETKTMRITFSNGKTYEYHGVPAQIYQRLKSAESIGKFFNQNVKNNYHGVKV